MASANTVMGPYMMNFSRMGTTAVPSGGVVFWLFSLSQVTNSLRQLLYFCTGLQADGNA